MDVIVEFGNNKNCRIPMQKSADRTDRENRMLNRPCCFHETGRLNALRFSLYNISIYCENFRAPSIFLPKYLKDKVKCGMIKTSIFYIWKDVQIWK